MSILFLPSGSFALSEMDGENLFIKHCSGCHINGGNIIRRNKTLKLKDLQRNGIDTPEAISKIAREGIGIMSGYEEVLGEGRDEVLAHWIWKQSQKAWVQG
ncbi:c-type cytochrome [Prochlorococcus marinus]|uniref:c-type cytochrome n=1 Tax=Prochlorococcus marinus TaxID=1219 RepID=UPI003D2B69CF